MSYAHVSIALHMPRSRSQWLAYFMGFGCVAWHDPMRHCAHPLDLVRLIDEWTAKNPGRRLFIADTLAGSFGKQLIAALPGAFFFKVDRPIEEVRASMMRVCGTDVGGAYGLAHHQRRLDALDELGVLSCRSDRLDEESLAYALWGRITGDEPLPYDTLRRARGKIIDYPVPHQFFRPELLTKLLRHLDPL